MNNYTIISEGQLPHQFRKTKLFIDDVKVCNFNALPRQDKIAYSKDAKVRIATGINTHRSNGHPFAVVGKRGHKRYHLYCMTELDAYVKGYEFLCGQDVLNYIEG